MRAARAHRSTGLADVGPCSPSGPPRRAPGCRSPHARPGQPRRHSAPREVSAGILRQIRARPAHLRLPLSGSSRPARACGASTSRSRWRRSARRSRLVALECSARRGRAPGCVGEVDTVEPGSTSSAAAGRAGGQPCCNAAPGDRAAPEATTRRRRRRPGDPMLADHDGRAALAREPRTSSSSPRAPPRRAGKWARRAGAVPARARASTRGRRAAARRRRARDSAVRARCAAPSASSAAARGARSRRGARRVLDAERRPRQDAAEHDLVLRVLEERRHRARELGGPSAGCRGRRSRRCLRTPAVKVRYEPGQRSDERRLPAPRPAGEQHDLSRARSRARRRRARPVGPPYENVSPRTVARATALPPRGPARR